MLKKLIALAIPMAISFHAQGSAFDTLEMQDLQQQAVKILRQQADLGRISMHGDVHSYEKLSDILKAIDIYTEELMEALETGADIEQLDGPVKNVETRCAIRTKTEATCGIMITYRPLGETYVEFVANLDDSQNVVSVNSAVYISRGD